MQDSSMRGTLFLVTFIALFLLFHIMSVQMGAQWANMSPFLALYFCAAALWKSSKVLLPAAIVCTIATPFFTNQFQGYTSSFEHTILPLIVPCLAYACITGAGLKFKNKKILTSLVGVLGCAIFFHLVTNLWCFATSTFYTKDLTGLLQSIWTTPNFSGALPTAVFFRNTCISSVLFTAMFLSAARLPVFRFKREEAKQNQAYSQ